MREFEVDVKKPAYLFIYEVVQAGIDAGIQRATDLYSNLVDYGLFYSPSTQSKSKKPQVKEVDKESFHFRPSQDSLQATNYSWNIGV